MWGGFFMQFKTDQIRRPLLAGIAGTGVAGLLAATAVVGVTAPAFATDVPCGVPARDAVYTTIYHAALPAVNGTEIVTPAKDAWTETIEVPAVTKTVYDIARYQRTGWVSLADKPAGWTQVAERVVQEYRVAQGAPTVQMPNPAYAPAQPPQGAPTMQLPNPAYVPGRTINHPAEYATVVVERELTKPSTEYQWFDTPWFHSGWKYTGDWRWRGPLNMEFLYERPSTLTQWFPETAKPNPSSGWTPTGNVRTGQRLTKEAWTETIPPVGEPFLTVPNPAYRPGQPAVGEQFLTLPNPGYLPEIAEVKEYQYALYETQTGVDVVPAGWTVKRERVVEIEPARTETVDHPAVPAVTRDIVVTPAKPAYTSTVLVTPATPAGPPCEDEAPPAQPGERIEVAMSDATDCEEGVVISTKTTTTTEYVWDAVDKAWELGEPVVTVDTDERAAKAECPAPAPVEEDDDEVAGVEQERPKPTSKPVNVVDTRDEVLGVEKSVAVPTAVNAGLGEAIVLGAERNVAGEAMLGGSGLMLLLAGWMRFGRRERRGASQA